MKTILPLLLCLYLLFRKWVWVKVEQLVNTTFMNPFTTDTMFPHLSFDTPLQKNGKLFDHDTEKVYLLARESFSDLKTYRFVQIYHSNLTSSYTSLTIEGYELNGMWQHQGKLDYFVGYHLESEKVHVCNLDTMYWKTVPITLPIEPHFIYADCKHSGTTGTSRMNTYIIAIGASSFDVLHPGQYNYIYAKFNTKFNLTETIVESNDPNVSERLVDVKVDLDHDRVYVILDINSNEYLGVTIYEAGDELTQDNPNIAAIAYQLNNAKIEWVKIFGDLNFADYYVGMEFTGNENILVLNSYTTEYSQKEPTKDIIVYKFRADTGFSEDKIIMGSDVDDIAYDLVGYYQGFYILASFGNNFYPHPDTGSVWGTPNNATAFGLIWISRKFELVDIEGYQQSLLSTLPMKVFPSTPDVYETQFMFISPTSTYEVNGVYISNFNNALNLFSTTDCNLTCSYCSRWTKQEDCIYCNYVQSEVLYKGEWSSICPIQTYQLTDSTDSLVKHCGEWHYSCKNWLGPRRDQCTYWCSSSDWGSALLDREMNMGEWKCPSGSVDSYGKWLERCANGLYGKMGDMWYENCPKYSYPEIIYDDPSSSNDYTHFEYSNDTDCTEYENLLKFNVASAGIEVPGPIGLNSMLNEFTVSFWAKPILLGTETYLLNLFGRVYVKIVSSKIYFLFERSASDFIEPTYIGTLNQISTGNWVYIAFSQKDYKNAGVHNIMQKLVIANGRTVDAIEAGSKLDHATATYNKFINTIFLGGYNYTNTLSFTGYIKEFKLFNQFHSSPQMINDRLRVHKVHSFDDSHLVAYWKLSENYTENDELQTIHDYSFHNMYEELSVSFSPSTNPSYPSFVYSPVNSLKLCLYHDVADCKAVKTYPQVISSGKQILDQSIFNPQSLSHIISTGDVIEFKTGDWVTGTIKAKITYSVSGFWVPDTTLNPEDLSDGMHYSTWLLAKKEGYTIPLGQIYIAKVSTSVDPSDISTVIIVGLEIQIDVKGGDESYGDIIRFSEDCDAPKTTDIYIERTTNLIYTPVVIKNFLLSRRYKMCLLPSYAQGMNFYMYNLNYHEWVAADSPDLNTKNKYAFYINDKPLDFIFDTPFTEGDKLAFAWKLSTEIDCNSTRFLSPEYEYTYGHFSMIWLGDSEGISGIDAQKEEIHMCWKSNSVGADPSYARVGLSSGHTYSFIAKGYADATRTPLPEISSIYPSYGSTELYGTDAQIQFNFGNENVFPAKRGGVNGKLGVYRGAILYDGSLEPILSSALYEITTLDEAFAPSNLEQGNIKCTALGSCNLTLSSATSTGMSPGEVYFLGFYPDSWSNDVGNSYYLFANNTNSGKPIYYHLFYSRSFEIVSTPANTVFGNTIVIEGTNLLEITNVLAKESNGGIATATWTTQSIKIRLSITASTWSSSLMPFASIYMENVNSTHITIKNMDLKGCTEGTLTADFEMIRGIKIDPNTWTHIRREYQKGVTLGTIACHSSCLSWDGPTDEDCVICINYLTEYLHNGKWYTSCPTSAPYWMLGSEIFESTEYRIKTWKSSCGKGYFVYNETNEWQACNLDCQTCNDNTIQGCLTWNPIMYNYYGMCTEFCPTPYYLPQNTNYQCANQNLTNYITVEIIKDPYLYKIPRNKQIYLGAYIRNNRGEIDSAKWTQISPSYSKVTDNVFTMPINNITNEVYNTQFSLKLKMTAFTFISEVTSVKYMLEVNNTMGDVAKQLTEIYVNPAPTAGTIQQEILTGQTKPVDGQICTLRIRLSGWFDRIDDLEQKLAFKFYYKYNDNYFILKNAGSLETFDVTLPYISRSNAGTNITISLWIDASDRYLATTTKCISLKEVSLSYTDAGLETLTNNAMAITSSQTDELLLTLASLEVTIPDYLRSPVQPHIWTVDFQCGNGVWDTFSGSNYWKCNQNYYGQNCQYPINIYHNLKVVAENFLAHSWTNYGSSTSLSLFDFDILVTTLHGLLKDPELLEYSAIEQLVVLFEKVSYMEDYKIIALQDYSLTKYFETAERILGKLYLERKKIKADPTHIRYPGMSQSDAMAAEQAQRVALNSFGGRVHDGIFSFIKKVMQRLGIDSSEYFYIGAMSFEFKVSIGYVPDFEGKQYTIRNNDIYWEIPTGILDNHQDLGSYKHQVYVLAIKWHANPHITNGGVLSQVGTNITSFSIFDSKGNEFNITSLTNYISVVFPYKKSTGYNEEFLKCQYYDRTTSTFQKTGWGSGFSDNVKLPCTTCAVDNSYIYSSVFIWRCSHLTTLGGVFEVNSASQRNDPRVGIYISDFALNYWRQSFGYYLLWPAIGVYLGSLIVAIIVDCFTLSKMRRKIEARILLIGELNEIEEEKEKEHKRLLLEGEEESKRLEETLLRRNTSTPKTLKAGNSSNKWKNGNSSYLSEEEKEAPLALLTATSEPKKKKKKLKRKIVRKKVQNSYLEEEKEGGEIEESKENTTNSNLKIPLSNEEEKDGRLIKAEPKKKKKIILKKKKKKNIFGTDATEDEKEEKEDMDNKSNGKSNGKSKGTPKGETEENKNEDKDNSDGSDKDKKTQVSENASNEEDFEKGKKHKFPSTIDVFENDRSFWSMIYYSNTFLNVIFVTSYLWPRHIRVSMLFTNLILIWFLVAVFYNNTKDPLVVPNFDKKARNLAMNEIWIALAVPLVSMSISYIFWGVFRVSDKRFHQNDTYERTKDGMMIKALLKEMYLRFFMAYFIMIAIFGAVMWYIIQFTAKFGWKVSWMWWYSGSFAFLFNYFFYDPIITWFHSIIHTWSSILWRKLMMFRGIKMACPEVVNSLHIPEISEERDKLIEKKIQEALEKKQLQEQAKAENNNDQFDGQIELQNQSIANGTAP